MKLHSLSVKGLRRLQDVTVLFGDATFCIGPNNAGKSSLLIAIDKLLSGDKRISEREYYSERDAETGETKVLADEITLEAEFRNVPLEASTWRGFKGRLFSYDVPDGSVETGKRFFYRKRFPLGKDVAVEIRSRKRHLKAAFGACKSPQDFLDAGASATDFTALFTDLAKKVPAKDNHLLLELDDLWELEDEEEWFLNPGGIPGVVLSKLPRFLHIPAEASTFELDDPRKGVLGKTLAELFADVRSASSNYKAAQLSLDLLARELDPGDEKSEFGKMMAELNSVLGRVFPDSRVHASADLSDPDTALVPSFHVELASNIRTPVANQGTGMVRAAVFGMLRFRQDWLSRRQETADRSLIVGFEEPEIYLHPSAANHMRDTIYELSAAHSQIVATTHSPFIIDLSRKPRQVLNRFRCPNQATEVQAFNVTDEFLRLAEVDKDYVKMIMRLDDHAARAFFTNSVVIVEGDSEDVVLREAIDRLPAPQRLRLRANVQIIKARGKASIIGLVKYLRVLGIELRVLHDRDGKTPGAAKFNAPIVKAVGDASRVVVLEECLEDLLGYAAPDSEKPLRAFEETKKWGQQWNDIPAPLRAKLEALFPEYLASPA